jgi:1-acyl-sn-glycerol-3-phosphate acyltransferase
MPPSPGAPEIADYAPPEAAALPCPWPLRGLKIAWLGFWAAAATALVTLPILILAPFSRTGEALFACARLWARIVLGVCGVRVRTRYLAPLDSSRTYMLISNHQSHFDGPALAVGLRHLSFRWIAKRELLRIPVFGRCLKATRNIFIDRRDRERAIASIREGVAALPPGVSVMCFAEGTRSADGRLGGFKKGGFAAAIEHGLPVLPVTINGSARALPRGSLCFHRGVIELVVGVPLETATLSAGDLEVLLERTRQAVQAQWRSLPAA